MGGEPDRGVARLAEAVLEQVADARRYANLAGLERRRREQLARPAV